MDTNEMKVKAALEKSAASNGKMPGSLEHPAEPAISIDSLLATGTHTKQTDFTGASGSAEATEAPKRPEIASNEATGAFRDGTNGGVTAGSLIGGEMAVNLLDIALPVLFIFVAAKMGYAMDKKGLQLSATEKKTVAVPMQAVLDRMMIDMNNPYANLALVMAIVYGSKVIENLPDIKKIKPKLNAEEKIIVTQKETEEAIKNIETLEDASNQEKYEAELKIQLRKRQKMNKKSYDKIMVDFEREGLIQKLKTKYNLK